MNEAEFTVERVAKIEGSLDLEPALQAEILGANELDAVAWERIEGTHDDALRSALEGGDTTRLEAYDAAYIARIEEERGAISPADYGSLVAASRSGSTASRLAELEIPEAAEMVLMRVFERRLTTDEGAKSELRDSLARDGG